MKAIIVLRNRSNPFPSSWDIVQEDNGWYSVYPLKREDPNVYLHARLMAQDATRSIFVMFAPSPALESRLADFAASSSNAWTLNELKADNGVLATAIKNLWRDKVGGVPTLLMSMSGFDYPDDLENGR